MNLTLKLAIIIVSLGLYSIVATVLLIQAWWLLHRVSEPKRNKLEKRKSEDLEKKK